MASSKEIGVHRQLLLSSVGHFTQKMFQYQNNKEYIVGEHHKLIFDALNKVIKGDTKRLIINIAPRYGKCIAPNTKIFTNRGLVNASDVVEGDMLYSYDNGNLVLQRCHGKECAHKESVRITMRSGRIIECSNDHPMLTTFGYKEASSIEVGERIVALRSVVEGNHEIADAELDFVDSFPYEIIRKEKMTYLTSKPPYRCMSTKEITREKFVRLSEAFPQLKKYILKDFYYDRVEKVENIGLMDLVHIGVDNTHNFIANGLVSHNTLLVSQMFIAYGLAVNPESKFIHLSYSASLSTENSMAVRDIVSTDYYQALFSTRIKYGSNQQAKWETAQGGGVYAVSTLGQVTGFGAGRVEKYGEDYEFSGAIVIDDPIKPEDALSDNIREQVNRRFETTIRNRVNSRNTPIVIIMQRLHEHDLCGYLQEIEPNEWEVLSLPCVTYDENGNEKALWEFKHSLEELRNLQQINPFVFETQYMQNPKPMEGFMYNRLRTYEELPLAKGKCKNYTDTADTGSDWLCSVCYMEYDFGLYITDVLYTKKPMEYTEVETAKMLVANNVKYVCIESNNGGRGFARNVEKNVRQLGNSAMSFRTFTQSANKQVRIFSRSADVQNMIYFPQDWELRWVDFARDIKAFRKEGQNAHDDAPDVLTGMIEKIGLFGDNVSDDEIFSMFL